MESPHNTTQFLIENNSTPFFNEDDDDDFEPKFIPNPLTLLKVSEDSLEENSLFLKKITSLSTQAESFPLDEQHLSFEHVISSE